MPADTDPSLQFDSIEDTIKAFSEYCSPYRSLHILPICAEGARMWKRPEAIPTGNANPHDSA